MQTWRAGSQARRYNWTGWDNNRIPCLVRVPAATTEIQTTAISLWTSSAWGHTTTGLITWSSRSLAVPDSHQDPTDGCIQEWTDRQCGMPIPSPDNEITVPRLTWWWAKNNRTVSQACNLLKNCPESVKKKLCVGNELYGVSNTLKTISDLQNWCRP